MPAPLIEFPAVVTAGVAYIGNYRGTIYALRMSSGAIDQSACRPP